MDLKFNKKQLMVQKNIRNFSRKVLGEWDHILDRESRSLPQDIVKLMGKLNIWGIQAPLEYGGAALDTISYSIIIEEISRVCASTGLGVTVHNSVCLAPILKFGTQDQIKRYAPYLASGKKIGGFTITEPQAGSDAAGIRTFAVKDGKNYIINGQKAFVTNGGTGRIFLVGAQYDAGNGQRQMAVFIMDKSMSGFETGKIEDLMGMRGNMVSELSFSDVKVPEGNLLGGTLNSFPMVMQTLDQDYYYNILQLTYQHPGRIWGIFSPAASIGTSYEKTKDRIMDTETEETIVYITLSGTFELSF